MRVLPPWVLQMFGLAMIVAFSIHWWTTGQESELLVGVGVIFATAGFAQGGYERLKRSLYKGDRDEESKQ